MTALSSFYIRFILTLFMSVPVLASGTVTAKPEPVAAVIDEKGEPVPLKPALTDKEKGEKFYDIKSFTLDNGLVVYLVENHRTPAAGITVVYRVGAADDPRGKSGLAHYVEHMMFKGAKGSMPERLMREVEAVGGHVNAATDYEKTIYYETVPKQHFEKFVKYEADRMRKLEVRLEDAAPEINVVLEEENMRIGNNHFLQFVMAMRSTYFRHHPYGILPIGYRDEIKSYTPEDVKSFHYQHYGPNNAFIILSGDLTLEEAQALITKYFADIPKRGGWQTPDRGRVNEPALTYSATIEQVSDRVGNPYIFRYSKAPAPTSENYDLMDALELGIYALTNSRTGVLHRSLVEDKKVASFITFQYAGVGSLDQDKIALISQTLDDVSLESLEKAIQEELDRILESGFTEEQLESFKQELFIQSDYIKDSLDSGSNNLVAPLVAGVPLERLEYWQAYSKRITAEDVNQALRMYLRPKHFVKGYLKPDLSNPNSRPKGQGMNPQAMMSETVHVR